MDRHTKVRYERNPGFLERVGGSLVGILVGLALILIGCALLFWNEVGYWPAAKAGPVVKWLGALDYSLQGALTTHMERDKFFCLCVIRCFTLGASVCPSTRLTMFELSEFLLQYHKALAKIIHSNLYITLFVITPFWI